MKRDSFAILTFGLLIGIIGCSSKNEISNSTVPKTLKQNDNPKQTIMPSQTTDLSMPQPTADTSYKTPIFNNDEIASAKKVAEEYYKGTTHKVESLELIKRNVLYDNYTSKYKKDSIITFSVKIKNSENPPRGIVLVRKDAGSEWKVLDEGY